MTGRAARILFVCTGNAGRSQMAEALLRASAGGRVEVFSAGVDPWDDLHPVARALLEARGLNLSGHHPKHVRTLAGERFDRVIVIGDRARDELPPMPRAATIEHWDIPDPRRRRWHPGATGRLHPHPRRHPNPRAAPRIAPLRRSVIRSRRRSRPPEAEESVDDYGGDHGGRVSRHGPGSTLPLERGTGGKRCVAIIGAHGTLTSSRP